MNADPGLETEPHRTMPSPQGHPSFSSYSSFLEKGWSMTPASLCNWGRRLGREMERRWPAPTKLQLRAPFSIPKLLLV